MSKLIVTYLDGTQEMYTGSDWNWYISEKITTVSKVNHSHYSYGKYYKTIFHNALRCIEETKE